MNMKSLRLLNIYSDDCSVCTENVPIIEEAARANEKISVFDLNFNLDNSDWKSWLSENSIADAPTLVAFEGAEMLGKLHGRVTAQEILELFPKEASS